MIRFWKRLALMGILILQVGLSQAQVSSVVREGAKPQLISRTFSFTEGPAVDKKGNVYFTDQPNNRIWQYDIHGKLSLFMEDAGRSNGMFFDTKGNLLACADEQNQLWSIRKNKQKTVLLDQIEGKLFNGPNDVWVSKQGDIYFTDPYYKRNYWTRTQDALPVKGLYVLYKDADEAVLLDSNFVRPNGIVGFPQENILYVADIGNNKTYKYTILPNGNLSPRELFVNKGSDGMTIDNEGNVYTTGKDVVVFDKNGKQISYIPVPEPKTTNLSFYGKNRDKLFITAGEGIYLLDMRVTGLK
ncbi:gluconolactonase [Pseudopedobacter saltans DSM 12145]|uniref:Gluconolactonase n=1 Tax=Pseudopedobacter saltans (strain ATCC 51119 / DSM 12145 / JCM 21818 / CCUG 39354 / LMG 10337 / NBRC 100064 / NCIMB 13643) TaxID=762903 RepID=F0SDD8_PSESL|nr:SMP-30/gluconolactonase/LRE family protein [Pseudopedobacter saltans]ADY53921.1 gluconolactonase [Pseudopedobacter saltans DSM 12145]